MCGIAGIISFQDNVNRNDLKQMTDTLIHRGPDGEGQWLNEQKNVGLGHRRLSIIDLSEAGHQPMHYANKRYSITFNGEIYNYIELKDFLQKKGYQFLSNTDTEVILAAYDFWKEECLQQFDGMFAFAIWDEKEQELFCARDRFGEKPFYYYKDHEKFIFASEMKALWKIGIEKSPSPQRVYEYLLFSTLENPFNRTQTFYNKISQLQPSHYFTLKINSSNTTIHQKKYWDIDLTKKSTLTFNQAKDEFLNLFVQSIEKRLRSDVTVGSSLSGGLDSSAIVCSIKQYFEQNIHQFNTFSAVFPGFEKDESTFINQVIDKTNFPSYTVTPNPDNFLSYFEKLIYHQEEPYGSASIAAQFEVMRLAKKNKTTVLLDGQGADEMLAGYTPLWETYLKQLLIKNPTSFTKEYNKFKGFNQFKINDSYAKITTDLLFYNFNKKIGNFRRQFIDSGSDFYLGIHPDLIHENKNIKNPIFKPPNLKEHLKFMLTQRGLNELLRYADRNSMAHSVEVRLPFLNHQLVEFLFSLPNEYLISDGWSKRILRESMNNILPKTIQWRKDKIGYEPPQKDWFKNKIINDKLQNAISILKEKQIIKNVNANLNWKYLMLGEVFQ